MPADVRTGFDVQLHGFGFTNRFQGAHVMVELARQGRIDDLFGPRVARPVRAALSIANRADFWGTFGLCGGMSWTAIDNYRQSRTSERSPNPPGPGDALFSLLVERQADSLRGSLLMTRLVRWMALPESNRWWNLWLASIGKEVIEDEWPALKASLDRGLPHGLCLMRSKHVNGLSQNHQVVAIGYSVDSRRRASVLLYDPNHPGDVPTLSFNTRSLVNRLDAVQSTGEPLLGFFVWPPATRSAPGRGMPPST
jgi:hypothetical protein